MIIWTRLISLHNSDGEKLYKEESRGPESEFPWFLIPCNEADVNTHNIINEMALDILVWFGLVWLCGPWILRSSDGISHFSGIFPLAQGGLNPLLPDSWSSRLPLGYFIAFTIFLTFRLHFL